MNLRALLTAAGVGAAAGGAIAVIVWTLLAEPGPDRSRQTGGGGVHAQNPPQTAHIPDDDLADRVNTLTRRLDRLSATVESLQADNRPALEPDSITAGPTAPENAEQVTVNTLVAAGFSTDGAAAVLDLVDRTTLDRMSRMLELRRNPQAVDRDVLESIPSVREAVTEQFGEQTYDEYLYASGSSNRVQVTSVMSASPAERAGILPGDTILEVAGTRVYRNRDLFRVAASDEADELIPVVLIRGGNRIQTYIPRGPFGVRTNPAAVDPRD